MPRSSAFRVERTGEVDPLTPRVVRFLVEALAGKSLDAIQLPEERKADYACLNGLLAVEVKTLEEDASARMENLTEELSKRDDWPIFLGSAPMESFLRHLPDRDAVSRKMIDRLGRAILTHLKKANKQLKAHREAFPRKNLVRVMILLNEDHAIYDPEMVAYILHRALQRTDERGPLYGEIDAVIFMSERHAAQEGDLIALPIVVLEGHEIETNRWKRDVVDLIVERWSAWNGIPHFWRKHGDRTFTTIDPIPEHAPRHERWRTDYRRNPYMKAWSNDQVRERFDECICVSTLGFLKNSPAKPTQESAMTAMRFFTHVMMEMAERAIPVTEFQYTPERLADAARRLGMPDQIVAWFASDCGRMSG